MLFGKHLFRKIYPTPTNLTESCVRSRPESVIFLREYNPIRPIRILRVPRLWKKELDTKPIVHFKLNNGQLLRQHNWEIAWRMITNSVRMSAGLFLSERYPCFRPLDSTSERNLFQTRNPMRFGAVVGLPVVQSMPTEFRVRVWVVLQPPERSFVDRWMWHEPTATVHCRPKCGQIPLPNRFEANVDSSKLYDTPVALLARVQPHAVLGSQSMIRDRPVFSHRITHTLFPFLISLPPAVQPSRKT